MRRQTVTTTLELTAADRQYLERIAEEKQVSLSAVARWILASERARGQLPATTTEQGWPRSAYGEQYEPTAT